jgi:predicted nucleic acid-binding protein
VSGGARAESFVEGLIAFLPVLPFDLDEARAHARLSADLQARGIAVGAHDLLIAATAVGTTTASSRGTCAAVRRFRNWTCSGYGRGPAALRPV